MIFGLVMHIVIEGIMVIMDKYSFPTPNTCVSWSEYTDMTY